MRLGLNPRCLPKQARERMLGRVVADALQRELAAPPPAGEPAAVLARALRLAADACALNAAMPALDDFTALRARCAAPTLFKSFLLLQARQHAATVGIPCSVPVPSVSGAPCKL